jgi:hypothetical protein
MRCDICNLTSPGVFPQGVRILDGPMTDSLEAMAFNMKDQINDIYSCSWGPDDNGKTVDGPHQLAQVYSIMLLLDKGNWRSYGN